MNPSEIIHEFSSPLVAADAVLVMEFRKPRLLDQFEYSCREINVWPHTPFTRVQLPNGHQQLLFRCEAGIEDEAIISYAHSPVPDWRLMTSRQYLAADHCGTFRDVVYTREGPRVKRPMIILRQRDDGYESLRYILCLEQLDFCGRVTHSELLDLLDVATRFDQASNEITVPPEVKVRMERFGNGTGWRLIFDEDCPYCGERHEHGAPEASQRYLGHRHAHCSAFPIVPHLGYALVLAKNPFRKASRPKRIPLTPRARYRVMERDSFRCVLCGATASTENPLEVDHVLPVSRGGTNEPANLRTLCLECNRGKGADLPLEAVEYRQPVSSDQQSEAVA